MRWGASERSTCAPTSNAVWTTVLRQSETLAGRIAYIELTPLGAIEVKRGLAVRRGKGFHIACEDLKPARRFVVNAGDERHPIDADTEAVGVREMAETLAAL